MPAVTAGRRRLSLDERETIAAALLRSHLGWGWPHIAAVLKRDETELKDRAAAHMEWQRRVDAQAQSLRETRPA
jgi:hypothetical protein